MLCSVVRWLVVGPDRRSGRLNVRTDVDHRSDVGSPDVERMSEVRPSREGLESDRREEVEGPTTEPTLPTTGARERLSSGGTTVGRALVLERDVCSLRVTRRVCIYFCSASLFIQVVRECAEGCFPEQVLEQMPSVRGKVLLSAAGGERSEAGRTGLKRSASGCRRWGERQVATVTPPVVEIVSTSVRKSLVSIEKCFACLLV